MSINRRWLINEETSSLLPTENKNIAKDADGKFWFWDETGSAACGPYEDIRSTLKGIEGYLKELG